MAIVKTNFYAQSLNQFAPNRLRGEYLDWGLNAQVMEVEIDASSAPIYAGDKVTIVATSKGKLKVKAAAGADKAYGYALYNSKHSVFNPGDIISVLRDGGVISAVTDEEISAGDVVYYDPADGGVTKTKGTLSGPMGIALAAVAAAENGVLIPVEVVKEPLA